MKKYLIVSGDSNTANDFSSASHPDMDFSYKKWPELLAENLGMKCINLARCGAGNEYIYTSLRDQIVKIKDKNEIGLVIAAWTQATRKDYKEGQNWTSLRIDPHGNLPFWVEKSLGHYLNFQILCERYNLTYTQFQMIELYEHYLYGLFPSQTDVEEGKNPYVQTEYPGDRNMDELRIFRFINEYEKMLDTSKIMGWPLTRKKSGWNFKYQSDIWKNPNSPRRISAIDDHPNKLGHIAVNNKINKLLQDYKIINLENGHFVRGKNNG